MYDGEKVVTPPALEGSEHSRGSFDLRKATVGLFAGAVIAANIFGGAPAAVVTPNVAPVNPYIYMQSIDNQDTAAIKKSLLCSASIIRDEHDQAVGALTAEHCGFYDQAALAPSAGAYGRPRIESSDGQQYIVLPDDSRDIYMGSDSSSLIKSGQITEVIVPTDSSTDQALLVFSGHSAAEVLRDYNALVMHQGLLPGTDRHFVPGKTTVYISGWPHEQMGVRHMGSTYGSPERQDFAGTFIQFGTVNTLAGTPMDVMWVAVPRNDDNASCTPGISGSSGRVLTVAPNGTNGTIVGTVSVGDSVDGQSVQGIVKAHPEIDWSQYATLCALAPNLLSGDDVTVLHVVQSVAEIPWPQISTETVAQEVFYDSSYQASTVKGVLVATTTQQVHGQEVVQTVTYENPIIFANRDGSVLVGYYDTVVGGLNVTRYANADELTFYAGGQSGAPQVIRTKNYGLIDPQSGDNNLGSFIDAQGYRFGIRDTQAKPSNGQAYSLSVMTDGTLAITPVAP